MLGVTAKYMPVKRSVTRTLYQYDYGQVLQFEGFDFSDPIEVHFCNKGDVTTITCLGSEDSVAIPDSLLETGKDIDAWVYSHNGDQDGETVYHVVIPVLQRGKIEQTADAVVDP